MRLFTTFILLLSYLNSNGQINPTRNWVDSEVKYTDSAGNSVMITNSLPKGGGDYKYYNGKKYSYVIFWTRVKNQSATQMEMAIKFPCDSLTIFKSAESHIKIFATKDTMTLEKIQLGDYGLTNLQSILDAEINQSSILKKTIDPKEDYFFYVPVFIHEARGTARADFVITGHDLFYKISIGSDTTLIPCGHLVFKK